MVRNQHGRVHFLSSDWVESTLNTEVLYDHCFFVRVTALNDNGFLHEVITDRTLQKVWHIEWLRLLIAIQVLCELVINLVRIIHCCSLSWELHCH